MIVTASATAVNADISLLPDPPTKCKNKYNGNGTESKKDRNTEEEWKGITEA